MTTPAPQDTRRKTLLASLGAHAALLGLLGWWGRGPLVPVNEPWPDAVELELLLARPDAPAPASSHVTAALTAELLPTPPRAAQPALPPPPPVVRGTTRAALVAPALPSLPALPAAPSPPAGPAPASSPFLTWAPPDPSHPAAAHVAPAAAPGSALNATGVLAAATGDTLQAATRDPSLAHNAEPAAGEPGGDAPVDAPAGDDATREARARASTEQYLNRMSEDAHLTQIAGSAPYYRALAREARTAWRPPPTPEPNLAEAIVGTFVSSEQAARDVARRSAGPLADGRGRAAIESLDFAHPNSQLPQLNNTMSARAAVTARTTRVEIELDQEPDGSIRAMRVIARSGVGGYDRAAMDAVRAAVARAAPPGVLHGGWRSRWAFEVTMSRDPILSTFNGLPGEPPAVGIAVEAEFDEVTGEFTLHYPGGLHRRSRVRVVSSRPILSPQVGAVAPRAR